MSKKNVKALLKYAEKEGMSEVESLKAQLNSAIGLIIAQKMKIATLNGEIKKLERELCCRPPATLDGTIKHFQD